MKLYVRLLGLSLGLCIGAQNLCAEESPRISATGSASVFKKADVAFVTLYVNGEGLLPSDAAKKAEENAEAVRKAIQESDKSIGAIEVSDTYIGEESPFTWSPSDQGKSRSPVVAKRIRVTLAPTKEIIQRVLDTGLRAGAVLKADFENTFSSDDDKGVVIYGLLKVEEAYKEVEAKALQDARTRAERVAALAGKKLGEILLINCGNSSAISGCGFHYKQSFPVDFKGRDPQQVQVGSVISVTYSLQ